MPKRPGPREGRCVNHTIEGLAELTLGAAELEPMLNFYEQTLGLQRISGHDDRVWLSVGSSARVGLWCPGKKEHGDEGGRHLHFAFSARVGGLSRLAERVVAAGREAELTEHEGGDRSLYVEDPEGNVVEFRDYYDRGNRRQV